ncbi:MAG: hypothetical protein FIB08_16770 [Candidatus Methanoperedens sp.]|nr:hypothetical protein [Candidatus Methanoperedens sp.]
MFPKDNDMQTIGTREDRGKAIVEKQGQIIRLNDKLYKVKSQSSEKLYDVKSTEIAGNVIAPTIEQGELSVSIYGLVKSASD